MKLRLQLALVACSLLAIPWAVVRFLSANEAALQALQHQMLEQRALSLAKQLSDKLDLLYPDLRRLKLSGGRDDLVARALSSAPIVDGYFGDWEQPNGQNLADERRPLRVALGVFRDRLYMAITIADRTKRYSREPILRYGDGDQLLVRVKLGTTLFDYAIAPAAPGFFSVVSTPGQQAVSNSGQASPIIPDLPEHRYTLQGAWVEFAEGYQLELSIPLKGVGYQLGLTYTDVDEGGTSTRGNVPSQPEQELPWLIYPSQALQAWFDQQMSGTLGAQVYDRWGTPLISRNAGGASGVDTDADTHANGSAISYWLYQHLLPGPDELTPIEDNRLALNELAVVGSTTDAAVIDAPTIESVFSPDAVDRGIHVRRHRGDEVIDRFITPIATPNGIVGAVAVEATRANYLSFNAAAVQTLLLQGGAAVLLSLVALFSFTGLISWRVIKLSRRITHYESTEPQPLGQFRWHDEIATLAQQFDKLLAHRDQTEQYLRALPRTLAHEIRTPIAIIGNSLEQLQGHALSTAETQTVLARTETALQRLSNMLSAMNEANRLEATIAADERQSMDLVALLQQLADAYQQTFPPWTIRLAVSPDTAVATVAADALVQAIDKLVGNAVSFATPNTVIDLHLVRRGLWWRLSVVNVGPALPDSTDGLFAPMVSMRDSGTRNRNENPSGHHMGLGLYIVSLVARQHGGEPWARNLPDLDGVEVGFTVRA